MKHVLNVFMIFITWFASAQSFTETIKKEISFEKVMDSNALMVANINGDVKVTGYKGDKIIIEVTKVIHAKTEARLQEGKQHLELGVIDRADTIIFYVKDGCHQFSRDSHNEKNRWAFNDWGYNWNCNGKDCETSYDYVLDFNIKVPEHVNLVLSTINEGDIEATSTLSSVKASNVNGSIKLINLVREAVASTINGDVDVDYTVNPSKDCRFYSLNGDINALFQKGLRADLAFQSFNGDFYTNINEIKQLPAVVEKNTDGKGMRYKINGSQYRVGQGGAFLDFETFNGNVYLKEK